MKNCTVFIPVLNEEDIIVRTTDRLLEFMEERRIGCELILGSNGSTDSTPRIIEELASGNSGIKAFHLAAKGPGRAFSRAVRMASHENVVSMDADLAVGLEFIPLALSFLESCDMVIGCKRMSVQNRSFLRRLGSNFFIFTAAVLLDVGAADFSIGAKAYRKSFVMEHIEKLDSGTAYVLELVYWAVTRGRNVVEVPVQCSDTRRSHFNLGREASHKFGHLFRFAWQEKVVKRSVAARQPLPR